MINSSSACCRASLRLATGSNAAKLAPAHGQKLDIVIAHHDAKNLKEMVALWEQVLTLPSVSFWPYLQQLRVPLA